MKKGELRRKNFEDLMKGIDEGPRDLPEGKEITDEEVTIRAGAFLSGFRLVEQTMRGRLNNLSFQVNKKALAGCQVKELIQFYNERVGAVLDAFVF